MTLQSGEWLTPVPHGLPPRGWFEHRTCDHKVACLGLQVHVGYIKNTHLRPPQRPGFLTARCLPPKNTAQQTAEGGLFCLARPTLTQVSWGISHQASPAPGATLGRKEENHLQRCLKPTRPQTLIAKDLPNMSTIKVNFLEK